MGDAADYLTEQGFDALFGDDDGPEREERKPKKQRPTIEAGKYITVFADASHCPYTRAWGYGFWAKWGIPAKSAYRSGGGQDCPNATVAESQALEAALRWILEEVTPREARGKILVVQSDCTGALAKLGPLLKHLKKTLKLEKAYSKHVKGHQGFGNARSAVNEICDQKARKEMKKFRAAWYAEPRDGMQPARFPELSGRDMVERDAALTEKFNSEAQTFRDAAGAAIAETGSELLKVADEMGFMPRGWKEEDMPEEALSPEDQITRWIETTERKFRQFNEPEKYSQPPPNPGNGMWREDAKRWANYTPEKKREVARMNLYPPAGVRSASRY